SRVKAQLLGEDRDEFVRVRLHETLESTREAVFLLRGVAHLGPPAFVPEPQRVAVAEVLQAAGERGWGLSKGPVREPLPTDPVGDGLGTEAVLYPLGLGGKLPDDMGWTQELARDFVDHDPDPVGDGVRYRDVGPEEPSPIGEAGELVGCGNRGFPGDGHWARPSSSSRFRW